MIDTLLRAVFAANNGYTVWLCFDDNTQPPTLDDLKKIEELTKDFLKEKGVKPIGSTPNTCGGRLGIRTPGRSHVNGFQDRRNRPLCQPSECYHFYKTITITL